MRNSIGMFLIAVFVSPLAAETLGDPMRPPSFALNKLKLEKLRDIPAPAATKAVTPTTPRWVLNSILLSSERRHAIINEKLVRPGEVIDGAKLIRLKPASARLMAQGKVIELTLPGRKASVKKSVKEN